MKTGRLDCPIDCQVIDNVKAQKSMKSQKDEQSFYVFGSTWG